MSNFESSSSYSALVASPSPFTTGLMRKTHKKTPAPIQTTFHRPTYSESEDEVIRVTINARTVSEDEELPACYWSDYEDSVCDDSQKQPVMNVSIELGVVCTIQHAYRRLRKIRLEPRYMASALIFAIFFVLVCFGGLTSTYTATTATSISHIIPPSGRPMRMAPSGGLAFAREAPRYQTVPPAAVESAITSPSVSGNMYAIRAARAAAIHSHSLPPSAMSEFGTVNTANSDSSKIAQIIIPPPPAYATEGRTASAKFRLLYVNVYATPVKDDHIETNLGKLFAGQTV